MKTAAVSLVALAASAAAQDYNTSAPFTLQVESANATLDGAYVSSCHAGAAIEELCVGGSEAPGSSGTYYQNTTADNNAFGSPLGPIFWNLPANVDGTIQNISSGLSFLYSPFSSVAVPLFQPGYGSVNIGFDADNKAFLVSPFDESTFQEGVYPNATSTAVYNWFVCFNYNLGYYYQALGWATSGTPSNPTCQAVNVTRSVI